MSRLVLVLFICGLLSSPLAAFAEASTTEQDATEASSTQEISPDLVPVYLFGTEDGHILGIAPITQDFGIGCVSKFSTTTEGEILLGSSEEPECFLLDFNLASSTPDVESEAGVGQRIYVGMERDDAVSLDYAINRYYSYDRGQFISQDPVHWEIGLTKDGKAAMLDPQLQNSYSWARNNPIIGKDPNGRFIQFLAPLIQAAFTIAEVSFTGTAGIKTVESAYTNFWLPNQYPTAFTDKQKAQAPFRFGAEAALNWGSSFTKTTFDSVAIDSILFGAEYMKSPQYQGNSGYRSPIQNYTSGYPGITQQLYGMLNYAANSSSISTRQQAVQGYNSSTGASSNESRLWLAPNGAIITWGGGVVAPAPSQSGNTKK